jgi:anti-sigma B factor antagonist
MFAVNTTTVENIQVVTMVGEIDGSTAPRAQEQILALAGTGTVGTGGKVILDMTGVTYMSSAGLRMLLLAYRTISGKGGKIVLVGLSSDLQDTMSATGFLDFFTCTDTLDAGLKELA